MNRRDFLKVSGSGIVGIALSGGVLSSCGKDPENGGQTPSQPLIETATGHFSLQQVSSTTPNGNYADNIGNSYILRTSGGKVIVMDGGLEGDAPHLRDLLLNKYGGVVDQWWVSHPHGDHIGAMIAILQNPQGITVKEVYHSRFTGSLLTSEGGNGSPVRILYAILDESKTIVTHDIQSVGGLYEIDGVLIKVLGISNPELLMTENETSPYNNSSMILRVWDADKSVIFLGDAQEECGDKLLTTNSRFYRYLTCDYLQMAHHGQQGVKESFYKSITFKYCLWPTPSWVWNPAAGSKLQTNRTKEWVTKKGIGEDKWIVSCLTKDWILE